MSEMIEFYRARLDEDERVARAAEDHTSLSFGEWPFWIDVDDDYAKQAAEAWRDRFSPARVLAEVDAKRRILAEYAALAANPERLHDAAMHMAYTLLGNVVRLQVQPYAEHPDYQDEWRP